MNTLYRLLAAYNNFSKVVDEITPIARLDLSPTSPVWLPHATYTSEELNKIIASEYRRQNASTLWGGYFERREMYRRSEVFTQGEIRSIHLGVDVWREAGAKVYTPLAGKIHSQQDNAGYGNYGPTIIIEHTLAGTKFYTLYGHLSQDSLNVYEDGAEVEPGQFIGKLGNEAENGNWPPHLHFQIIENLEGNYGDYPGVAPPSQHEHFRQNCPDPNLILGF
jgi:murein DD-endopeptidase MepM/ murein hydrolase activator NlpD